MDALSQVYDAQQRLVRSVERRSHEDLVRTTMAVIAQLDRALAAGGFVRPDYWPEELGNWQPRNSPSHARVITEHNATLASR